MPFVNQSSRIFEKDLGDLPVKIDLTKLYKEIKKFLTDKNLELVEIAYQTFLKGEEEVDEHL
jgi:hypothetical protein